MLNKFHALSDKVKQRLQEHEAIAVVEAVGAATLASYLNVTKSNSTGGTYRLGVQAGGAGGVDADLVAGLGAGLVGLAIDPQIGSHLVAVATGLLCGFGARQGAQMGAKKVAAAATPATTTTQATGASLNQMMANGRRPLAFNPRQQFVQNFGALHPVYGGAGQNPQAGY
jgi:hypothetical protein